MWFKPANESTIATPCVLLFPHRIEENIRRMIRLAGSAERLRPHVKTHKIAEIVQLQLHHGIQSFKCATLTEVEMVAEAGGLDILLAYPLQGPATGLWFDLMDRFPECRMAVTVDSEAALGQIRDQAEKRRKQAAVFVDLDNGMHRTGIVPEEAHGLITTLVNTPWLRFGGLHIYDGHIHDLDPDERKAHCEQDFEAVDKLLDQLEKDGIEVNELACGGTPTFPIHAAHSSRKLCPGTPLLWDAGYSQTIPDLDFLPAAVVAGRIISKPIQHVCLDLGYKSIASEMKHPRLQFLNLEYEEVLNHSEEHMVLSTQDAVNLTEGAVIYALPSHICPTMALHEYVYVVRKQEVTETWKVLARKRKYPL